MIGGCGAAAHDQTAASPRLPDGRELLAADCACRYVALLEMEDWTRSTARGDSVSDRGHGRFGGEDEEVRDGLARDLLRCAHRFVT